MTPSDVVQLEWFHLAPFIALLVGGTLGVTVEAFAPRTWRYPIQVVLTIFTILLAGMFLVFNWIGGGMRPIAFGTFVMDQPAYLFMLLILIFGLLAVGLFAERRLGGGASAFVASAATTPGSQLEREANRLRREHTEVFPLLLFSVLGMTMFVAASDMLTMFVSLEIFSLPLYLLCGMARRRRLLSQESAMKYFLLGAFSSAFFLFGAALLYGYSGSLDFAGIAAAVDLGTGPEWLLIAGMIFVSVGLLFKVGAVPFHSWTPDVYGGAPTPVTAFMAAATKTAAVAGLLRVFFVALGGLLWNWQLMLSVIAVLTMIVGSVVALMQDDIKRLLAYSSIVHAGFLLVGVAGAVVATPQIGALTSVSAIAFYMLAYGLASFGAFAVVTMVRRAGGEATNLAAWKGIGRRSPFIGALMTVFMLSFAGIPLTAGFIGKFVVFSTAWQGGQTWLVAAALVLSVVAAGIYLKVMGTIWFADPDPAQAGEVLNPSMATGMVLMLCAFTTLVLGIVPGPFLELFATAAPFIR